MNEKEIQAKFLHEAIKDMEEGLYAPGGKRGYEIYWAIKRAAKEADSAQQRLTQG